MTLQHMKLKKDTQLARLIESTSLVVWDEAPMNHKNYFEVFDKTLKDILQKKNKSTNEKIFDGKTILLGGDFR